MRPALVALVLLTACAGSIGHYENLMGNYAKLGCGIFQSGSDVTLVQDYGP
jgi:hypothetical protein